MPSQNSLIESMKRDYAQERQAFKHDAGVCSGLTARFLYYASLGQMDRFIAELKLLRTTDPANHAQRMALARDVATCQSPSGYGLPFGQTEICTLLDLIHQQKTKAQNTELRALDPANSAPAYIDLYKFHMTLNRDQLIYVLQQLIKEGQLVQIGASRHAGGFVLEKGVYYCYEPNLGDRTSDHLNVIAHTTVEGLVDEMIQQGFFHNFTTGNGRGFIEQHGDRFQIGLFAAARIGSKAAETPFPDPAEVLAKSGALGVFDVTEKSPLTQQSAASYLLGENSSYSVIAALAKNRQLENMPAEDLIIRCKDISDERVIDLIVAMQADKTDQAFLDSFALMAALNAFGATQHAPLRAFLRFLQTSSKADAAIEFLITNIIAKNKSRGLLVALPMINASRPNVTAAAAYRNGNAVDLINKALQHNNRDLIAALINHWPKLPHLNVGQDALRFFQACCTSNNEIPNSETLSPTYRELGLRMACLFGNKKAIDAIHGQLHPNPQQAASPLPPDHISALLACANDECISSVLADDKLIPHVVVDQKTGDQLAHTLVRRNALRSLKIELQRRPDAIAERNNDKQTPLLLALELGHYEIAADLLGRGESVFDLHDQSGGNVLHVAVTSVPARGENLSREMMVEKLIKRLVVARPDNTTITVDNALAQRDKQGNTPLLLACQIDDVNVVRQLVECGADINTLNDDGDSALHIAARAGSLNVMRYLLSQIKNVGVEQQDPIFRLKNKKGHTPLHVACDARDTLMMEALRDHWAGTTNDAATKKNPMLPLTSACWGESPELASQLIERWGEPAAGHPSVAKPLSAAVMMGDMAMIELLLNKSGAKSCNTSESVKASEQLLERAVISGKLSVLQLVLMNLAGPPAAEEELKEWRKRIGQAIDQAWDRNRYDMMRAILRYEEVQKNLDVTKAMRRAIKENDAAALECFFAAKYFDPFRADTDGNTLLHTACIHLSVEAVSLLLQSETLATPNKDILSIRNNAKQTALDILKNREAAEKAKGAAGDKNVIEKCKQITVLCRSIEAIPAQVPLQMLSADAHQQDQRGIAPLHLAVVNLDKKTMHLLLARGADVNIVDARGNTPLHLAAMLNDKKTVELLIRAGADISKKNDQGNTAAAYAVANGNHELNTLLGGEVTLHGLVAANEIEQVKDMLYRGMYNEAVNPRGKTPLQVAEENQLSQMRDLLRHAHPSQQNSPLHLAILNRDDGQVFYLLKTKASLLAKNSQGLTPLQLARKIGYENGITMIQKDMRKNKKLLVGDSFDPLNFVEVGTWTHTPGQQALAILASRLVQKTHYIAEPKSVVTQLRGDGTGLTLDFQAGNESYAQTLCDRLRDQHGFCHVSADGAKLCIASHNNNEVDEVHREIGVLITEICNTNQVTKEKGFSYLRDLYCDNSGKESGVKLDPTDVDQLRKRFNAVHLVHKARASEGGFLSKLFGGAKQEDIEISGPKRTSPTTKK